MGLSKVRFKAVLFRTYYYIGNFRGGESSYSKRAISGVALSEVDGTTRTLEKIPQIFQKIDKKLYFIGKTVWNFYYS